MVKEAATEDRMNMILVTMDAGTMAGTVVVMMMDDVDMEEGEMTMETTICVSFSEFLQVERFYSCGGFARPSDCYARVLA